MKYAELEDLIISALQPLLSEGVREIRPYAGELTAEAAGSVAYRMPAVFVYISEMRREAELSNQAWHNYGITLYIADRSLRRAGDASGCYWIAERIRELLLGKKIDGYSLALSMERVLGVSIDTALMEAVYNLKMLIVEV